MSNTELPFPKKISPHEWLLIIAILLIAFALRTIDLTRVPPGMHNDEVVAAKITESVLNGKVAIFFTGDTGSEPLSYYFTAPLMKLFGNTVYALRLPAIAISLIAMSIVFTFARRLFGSIVALTALAGYAIVFWTVEFGRIVSPVVFMLPPAILCAYFFWRGYLSAKPKRWWFLAGLMLGAALITYTAARILPGVFIVFGAYVLIAQRAQWRRWFTGIAITVIVGAIVSAPMFIYLANDPEADNLNAFDIDRPFTELKNGNVQPVIETSLRTLGMFTFVGDPLPYYDVPDRPIFDPVTSLLFMTGILIAFWRWRKVEYAFMLIWFFVSLAPGMLSQPAPNYTRTLGAQVVLFLLPGFAVAALLNRWRSKIIVAALALLLIGNIAWTARDYFTVWPSVDTVRFWHQSGLYAVTQELQKNPDTSPVAICLPDNLIDERTWWWNPAWQHVHFLLHRSDIFVRYYNCADTAILIDGVARYAFPDAIDDQALHTLLINSEFLDRAKPDRLVLPDRAGVIWRVDRSQTPLAQRLTQISASSIVSSEAHSLLQIPINLANKVNFLGYTLSTDKIKRGNAIDLITYWRVTAQLPPQLSQFTHVLNGQGDIAAQQDRLMLTSQSLQAGDVFIQIHHIDLPGDLKPGPYQLAIGLYTTTDGKRLPIIFNGQPSGDRVFLRSINVVK